MGGGFEICLGADMIVASPQATFGLPEAMRGLYAGAGGLSRLVRLAGITVASEISMAGRFLKADEAARYLIANRVSKTHESCVSEAVELASKVASLSPDAIIVRITRIRGRFSDVFIQADTNTSSTGDQARPSAKLGASQCRTSEPRDRTQIRSRPSRRREYWNWASSLCREERPQMGTV